jgi:hypothetical protein
VTLPVPASTDPVADAAAHIAALADAIAARLSGRSVAYFSGVVATNATGDFAVPGIAGVLSYCSGAIVTDNSTTPRLYRFGGAGPPGSTWIRVYTHNGGGYGATSIDVSVLAFGTPA